MDVLVQTLETDRWILLKTNLSFSDDFLYLNYVFVTLLHLQCLCSKQSSVFLLFRSDSEITGYALDALCNVLSNEPLDDGKHFIWILLMQFFMIWSFLDEFTLKKKVFQMFMFFWGCELFYCLFGKLLFKLSHFPDDESNMPANLPGDLGAQFTEIFTKKQENVSLLLSLLEVCYY